MPLTAGQQRCVDTVDRSLVVAAGAGSGKTFTLTKRIVSALQSGFIEDIGEVCAITFTKRAAAELKSRIKAELRACGMVDQALKVDDAWVSTIHGMCARMLRAHAVELGIDPAFTVAEGADADEYLARAIDRVLVEAQTGDSSPAIDALFAEYPARSGGGYGASVEGMLRTLVAAASSHAQGTGAFVMPGVTVQPVQAALAALDLVDDLLVAAGMEKESAKRDEWASATAQVVANGRELLSNGRAGAREALAALAPLKLAKTFGSRDYRARVDEARGMVGAYAMEVRLGAARDHLQVLVTLAQRVLDAYAAAKREGGVLDNNDLLVLAARAIEGHPAIAEQYAGKFGLVMVDEFQDTDQMQVDMIRRLAGPGGERLCTVGDAQQSIYRFRGADVSVYRRHLESVRAGWPDSVIRLSDNFRSHADVLAFVDRVFEKPDMFGGEFMSLGAGRDESKVRAPFGEGPRITVQHTTRPWRGVDGSTVVQGSARRIAAKFAELHRAGHAPGEMVVLLGRMTNSAVYAQAMRDAGLPCVISGGSVFAQSLEARVMAELVHAIANPNETRALFNVLTSPLFRLTAGDLLQVGGLKRFASRAIAHGPAEDGEASPQLVCALRVMGRAWRRVADEPVSGIAERVVVESGWLSRLQERGPEGLAAAGNVFKALRMVAAAEGPGPLGPATTMRAFDAALEGSKEAPGALSVSGGDSVRIMTIHASKGLEFPIVAVAEMKDPRPPSSKLLVSSVAGKVYLSLDLNRTLDAVGDSVDASAMQAVSDYVLGEAGGEDELVGLVAQDAGALHRRLALRSYIAAGDAEEAKRLLYVALTRAKEALVVATTGVRLKSNPDGLPKGAFAGVFAALDPAGAGLGAGTTHVRFGGSAPAVVECVALEGDDEPAGGEGRQDAGSGREPFMVPAPAGFAEPYREPFKPYREGVFSYSSIAEASHAGDFLDRLADRFAVSVDPGLADPEAPARDPRPETSPEGMAGPVGGTGAEAPDADGWDSAPPAAFDDDRATDLGTAFHRLAQYSVVQRGGGALAAPPDDRLQALCRTCNLDADQRARLGAALDRWLASDVARAVARLPFLAAEVPFFVRVPDAAQGGAAYLEGEIDLLGFDAERLRAHVVDYKTGGRDDEAPAELARKHVLQACCYAYAVLQQGAREVDAVFVRVERPREEGSAQPQCVRYRFTGADLPLLARAIGQGYRM